MDSGSGEDTEGGVFVRLVERKSGSGVAWVLEMSEAERVVADSRSLDCTGSFAIANDPASLGMTDHEEMLATELSETLGMTNYGGTLEATDPRATNELQSHGIVIPWIQAVTDPHVKWWELRKNDPKRSEEISQAAFLLRARGSWDLKSRCLGETASAMTLWCGWRNVVRCIECR
jgi:hypothetical protein